MIPNFLVIDNFYTDVDAVISMIPEFTSGIGCGGIYSARSPSLIEIDTKFNEAFCQALCQLYNLDRSKVSIGSHFNKQTYNPIHIYNDGMIHIDGRNSTTGELSEFHTYRLLVVGQIVLSETKNSSINMYKDTSDRTEKEKFDYAIRSCYNEKSWMTPEQYANHLVEYNKYFQLTNYSHCSKNRLVSWKAGTSHKTVLKDDHLITQSFYISLV